jgi:cation diffusion facilitator family transporter
MPPASFAIWPLAAAIVAKAILATTKFRYGRRIGSAALVADGWNDAVDILSGGAALTALGLTLYDPVRFLAADHFGGFAVGLIVISIGLRVARDTSLDLMDTMPPAPFLDRVRAAAARVDGARGVEKCWARKTGLRYHVDLHLEVDPAISVAESHGIAEQVRHQIRRDVADVADVLVHVEPSPMIPSKVPVIQETGSKKWRDG